MHSHRHTHIYIIICTAKFFIDMFTLFFFVYATVYKPVCFSLQFI